MNFKGGNDAHVASVWIELLWEASCSWLTRFLKCSYDSVEVVENLVRGSKEKTLLTERHVFENKHGLLTECVSRFPELPIPVLIFAPLAILHGPTRSCQFVQVSKLAGCRSETQGNSISTVAVSSES